jgi:hypothetical protein
MGKQGFKSQMLANPITIARWMIVTGIAGLLVIAALASWFLRDQIYQTFQDPGEPFQTYAPPDGVDYAQANRPSFLSTQRPIRVGRTGMRTWARKAPTGP